MTAGSDTSAVEFGFASFADGSFELIIRNKMGDETMLEGQLRTGQLDFVDRILPTCAYVTAIPVRAEQQRSFWVVERFENGKSAGYWGGGHSRQFIMDINKAIQFCRRDDAMWCITGWHWKDVELTEHIMIGDTPAKRASTPPVAKLPDADTSDPPFHPPPD